MGLDDVVNHGFGHIQILEKPVQSIASSRNPGKGKKIGGEKGQGEVLTFLGILRVQRRGLWGLYADKKKKGWVYRRSIQNERRSGTGDSHRD